MENISSKGEQTQIGYTSEIRTSGIPFGLADGTMVTDRWTPLRSMTIETESNSLAAMAHTAEGLRVHGLLTYGAAMGASWHLLGHLDDPSVEIRVVRHKLTTTWKVEEEGIVEMSPLVLPIRMNAQHQREAIATFLGWKVFPYVVINGHRREEPTWVDPRRAELFTPDSPGPGCFAGSRTPDYPGDLNAMHEAENRLSDGQWVDYIDHLKIILNAHAGNYRSVKAKINATAAQKAEAFLKALNLWKT